MKAEALAIGHGQGPPARLRVIDIDPSPALPTGIYKMAIVRSVDRRQREPVDTATQKHIDQDFLSAAAGKHSGNKTEVHGCSAGGRAGYLQELAASQDALEVFERSSFHRSLLSAA